jgi:hypothetical protein
MELPSDEALYLFCLTRKDRLKSLEGKGIDGSSPLFLHTVGDVDAVMSRIPLEELGGIEKTEDPSWVSPRAARHAEVIEWVASRAPVLPVRFGMLFASYERLDGLLAERSEEVLTFLDRVEGFEEWSIKAYLDRRKARAGFHEAHGAPVPDVAQGGVDGETMAWVDAKKGELCELFRSASADLIERVMGPCDTSAEGREPVWNWALLMEKACRDRLGAIVGRVGFDLEEKGLVLKVSGPWPPYSFAPSLIREC